MRPQPRPEAAPARSAVRPTRRRMHWRRVALDEVRHQSAFRMLEPMDKEARQDDDLWGVFLASVSAFTALWLLAKCGPTLFPWLFA